MPRVLIVDDDLGTVESYSDVFRAEAFDVFATTSPSEAIRIVKRESIDIALVDLRLQATSGLALLRQIQDSGAATAVVIVTGFGSVGSAVDAMKLGAVDYVEKPLIGSDLISVASRALSRFHSSRSRLIPDATMASGFEAARLGAAINTLIETVSCDDAQGAIDRTQMLAAAAISMVAGAQLPLSAFIACADALRGVISGLESLSSAQIRDRLLDVVARFVPSGDSEHTSNRRVSQFVDEAIRNNQVTLSWTEAKWAVAMGVDPSHLGRLLFAETGLRFRDWHRGIRIREALLRVRSGSDPVAQIGFAAGYEHPSQFSREFRQLIGANPRALRRVYRRLDALTKGHRSTSSRPGEC
jgi:ActR/RegA family two-component response regulator/AraC-like DNA-binding protein